MTTFIARYVVEINLQQEHSPVDIVQEECDALRTAFSEAFRLCQESGIADIILLVPSRDFERNFSSVVKFLESLGANMFRDISSRKSRSLPNGLSLALETLKTFDRYGHYGMVMGLYVDGSDVLDSIEHVQAILLLPWREGTGRDWLSTWNATILRQRNWQAEPLLFDPAFEAGLEALDQQFLKYAPMSKTYNKQLVRDSFTKLKKQGLWADPDDIRRWAFRHGWGPNAMKLKEISEKYF